VERTAADLGWALGTIKRAYLEAVTGVVADVPGGPRGYLVLATTGRGEPRSQLALAQHLGVDRTAMTYLIDDLERAGLVERKPDPTDRRARRVAITESGRSLLHEVKGRLERAEDELLFCLEEPDRTTLRTLLQRLATALAPADPCEIMDAIVGGAECPGSVARRRR
jgi:DNA-binding MarR family transcriptional regulator